MLPHHNIQLFNCEHGIADEISREQVAKALRFARRMKREISVFRYPISNHYLISSAASKMSVQTPCGGLTKLTK